MKMKKLFPFLLLTSISLFSATSVAKTYLYLSNQDKGNISLYSFDINNGEPKYVRDFIAMQDIIAIYIMPNKKYFYASSLSNYNSGGVLSWKIDPITGYLKEKYVSVENGVRYISSEKNSKILFLSQPETIVSAFQIPDNSYFVRYRYNEYSLLREVEVPTVANMSVSVDNINKNIYISNKYYEPIHYTLSDNIIQVDEIKRKWPVSDEGSSYSVISPDNKYLYNLTYKSGNIVQYKINEEDGRLSKISEIISPLYDKYSKSPNQDVKFEGRDNSNYYTDNDLRMTSDGKFIYTSDNVNNTIRGYKINKNDGKLSLINTWKTENIPTNFVIDDTNKWLIVSGEKSDYIGIYSIDSDNGYLTLSKRVKVFDDKGKEGQKAISIVTF